MMELNEETGQWMGNGGESDVSSVTPSGSTGTFNDVWGTLLKSATAIIPGIVNANANVAVARANASARVLAQPQVVTAASPQGSPAARNWNPFPGLFSAFPQNDAKNGSAVPAGSGFALTPGIIFLIIAAIVGVFLMRR